MATWLFGVGDRQSRRPALAPFAREHRQEFLAPTRGIRGEAAFAAEPVLQRRQHRRTAAAAAVGIVLAAAVVPQLMPHAEHVGVVGGGVDRVGDVDAAIHRHACERVLVFRSEEHTSELQSLMRVSYAVFCSKKKYTNL